MLRDGRPIRCDDVDDGRVVVVLGRTGAVGVVHRGGPLIWVVVKALDPVQVLEETVPLGVMSVVRSCAATWASSRKKKKKIEAWVRWQALRRHPGANAPRIGCVASSS